MRGKRLFLAIPQDVYLDQKRLLENAYYFFLIILEGVARLKFEEDDYRLYKNIFNGVKTAYEKTDYLARNWLDNCFVKKKS